MIKTKEYKIKSFTWTSDNDARLKHLREQETPRDRIAKILGCSEGLVYRRLRVLNLTDMKWTSVQDKVLKDNYLTHTNKELAQMLKVDEMSVQDRRSYLNLLRKRGPKVEK